MIVYKCIIGKFSKKLTIQYKTYNCRPDDYLLLKGKSVKTKYGKRTFDYAAPRLWNALPLHVRTAENIDLFKKHIKTILFKDTEKFKQIAFKYG